MASTGITATHLAILRGNAASGESSIAAAVRLTEPPMALIEQDHLRRKLLKEHDAREATDIVHLIDLIARFCLDRGRNVLIEGILHEAKYGGMLRQLIADHRGRSFAYYLDVPFEETVIRHAGRPQRAEFGAERMREWFVADDLLGLPDEIVVVANSSLDATVGRIRADLGQIPS